MSLFWYYYLDGNNNIKMIHFNEIIISDPMIESLDEIDIGAITLTCKDNLVNMQMKMGFHKINHCLKIYLSLIENDYRLLDNDENFFHWTKRLVENEMYKFPEYCTILYDDIEHILEKYSDRTIKDIIILMEYHKRLPLYYNRIDKSKINNNFLHKATFYGRRILVWLGYDGDYGDYVDHVTFYFKLCDLLSCGIQPHDLTYKKICSLDFFEKIELEIGGQKIYDFYFAKNEHKLCNIIDNKIYFSVNFRDVFPESKGIALKYLERNTVRIYIQFKNIFGIFDSPFELNMIDYDLHVDNAYVYCRFLNEAQVSLESEILTQNVIRHYSYSIACPIPNIIYGLTIIHQTEVEILALHLKMKDKVLKKYPFDISILSVIRKILFFTFPDISECVGINVIIEYKQIAHYQNGTLVLSEFKVYPHMWDLLSVQK
jgi:hypothetical protein